METNANVRGKRGPKPDPLRAQMRASFREWSDRTFDTWWRGFTMARKWVEDGLITHDEKVEIAQAIQDKIQRPNGTFSVRRYLQYVEAVDRDLREYDLGHDEAPGGNQGLEVGGSAPQSDTTEVVS